MKKKKNRILSFIIVTGLIIAACGIYLGDYYRAEPEAIVSFSSDENIAAAALENGTVVFEPEEAASGLIFYPGGKVEHLAYEPLMADLARNGILCILVQMPFNLAVFDINAADGLQAQYPQIENWYIGGHSLGGSMAASYLKNNAEDYSGLILLASYSTADLSDTGLDVLSIYGSEDHVLNREKYDKYRSNLPENTEEIIIQGGCHSYFGMYGEQKGDGTPSITASEQIRITSEHITDMIRQHVH